MTGLAPLIVRADSSAAVGAGHVMRCIAVAEEWRRRDGRVVLLARELLPFSRASWEPVASLIDVRADADDALVAIAEREGAPFILIDGYGFGPEHEARAAQSGRVVVAFDDHGTSHAAARIVVNSAPGATPSPVLSPVQLLGPRYAQIRAAVRAVSRHRRADEAPRSLLVIAGAMDTASIALMATRAGRRCGLDVVVPLASAASARAREIEAAGARVVMDADLPALMRESDLAIAAAGVSALELCAAGVPCIAVRTAENQRALYAGLVSAGAVHAGGVANGDDQKHADEASLAGALAPLVRDASDRAALRERAQRVVDGHGAARLAAAMTHSELIVRPARRDDAQLVFQWANDPEVRRVSFNSDPISWETHVAWFDRVLADDKRLLLIGEGPSGPLGQVRFDVDEDRKRAVISVSVDPRHRGGGTGTALIERGVAEVSLHSGVAEIVAEVKADNAASLKAFEKAGFATTTDPRADRVVLARAPTSSRVESP